MLSDKDEVRSIGNVISTVVLAFAAGTALMVFQRLNLHRPDDAGMRALLCLLLALAITKAVRKAVDRWAQQQKLVPLLVFDGSLAVAISCLLWLIFYS